VNRPSSAPAALVRSVVRNRDLIVALTRRDILGRYRGSLFGLLWSFFNPLLMLAVYTFVFAVVFRSRWPGAEGSRAEFALILFSALIAFSLFAECVNRAPGLILANTSYVTRIVFPLEILPVVTFLASGFHFLVSLLVWLLFYAAFIGVPHASVLLLPLVLVPLALLVLGLCWFLSSLGVYLRDVAQIVTVMTTMLMFLSPIFYPLSAVPPNLQTLMRANPLTGTIEQVRDVMLWGHAPDWQAWALQTAIAALVAWLGFAWFQKTRRGFADVL
jgi:homopolymeric O-antigen transport system permease protein